MKEKLVHALEGAAVAVLGLVPAMASSSAVQHFIEKHPADAALVPVAVGVASAAYRWLKRKATTKAAVVVPAAPVAPVVAAPVDPAPTKPGA